MTSYEYSISEDTHGGLNSYTLQQQIAAASGIGQLADHISGSGDLFEVHFTNALTTEQEAALDALVAAHNGKTTVEQLTEYLDYVIHPFVKELINTFAAENIAMGITQAGKSGHVLALYSKKYPVPSAGFENSLKGAFDSGSLYVARDILIYLRANSTEFDGLSPFITDARLLAMLNKIETFLGVPLSE